MSAPIYTDPPPPQNAARDDGNLPKNISYDEYKARNLRRYRSNHYTDSDGYANYGYLNVNGCWVDPDGKREIYEAENGLLGEFHVPRIPIGITPVPKLTEDQLYAKFIEEVSDGPDGDLEGDPRAMYITPAIFARWAAGASLGDHFVVPKTGSAVSCHLCRVDIALVITDYIRKKLSEICVPASVCPSHLLESNPNSMKPMAQSFLASIVLTTHLLSL